MMSGIILLSILTILFSVWNATKKHAQKQAQDNLAVAEEVLKNVIASTENQLVIAAEVLTADFGFKQAIASGDQTTILSTLQNHGQRISADLMGAISLQGEVIASTSAGLDIEKLFLSDDITQSVLSGNRTVSLVLLDSRIYQVVLLEIKAPIPIAVAVIGFEINQGFVDQMKKIVNLDVTIFGLEKGVMTAVVGTFSQEEYNKKIISKVAASEKKEMPNYGQYFFKYFSIFEDDNFTINLLLSEDVSAIYSEFNVLYIRIAFIALFAIVIAFLASALFSKRLTQPLYLLAHITRDIARGDYNKEISIEENSTEISDLVSSFESMRNDICEREGEIQFQADHDLLTQLYNRFWISSYIASELKGKSTFQVFIINIINLRSINDIFGYESGDDYIRSIACRTRMLGGKAARLNGGEFLWLPERQLELDEILRVREQLEKSHEINDMAIETKISIGELQFPMHFDSVEVLFRRLNIVVEQAKRQPARFAHYEQAFEEEYLLRLRTIAELKKVFTENRDELQVYYQPQMCLSTGRVDKAEALIRWNNPTLGKLSPEYFIPVAEQAGLISSITRWVVKRVIRDLVDWIEYGSQLQIAVNFSMSDLNNKELLAELVNYLKDAKLPQSALAFEITESEMMREPENTISQLEDIRAKGFELAIDDFGTGYSSLAYLKSMPINALKIDKSFVLNLVDEPDDQEIVRTVIALAHSLGLIVVAEGVENEASLELLKKWGCERIQGYYLGKPMPSSHFREWLEERD